MDFGNAIVVFDLDGTLCEFKYGENTLLGAPEAELGEYAKHNDYYKNVRPLKLMQNIVAGLDS